MNSNELFANVVKSLVSKIPASKRFGDKVYISDLLEKCDGYYTVEELKAKLAKCHQAGLIVLSRADLVMDVEKERASLTKLNNSEFHYIRL
jgi:hypothetical protein